MKKRVIALLLSLFMILAVFPAGSSALEYPIRGYCGENLTWALDENRVLTISGTGDMFDFESQADVPWTDLVGEITYLNIESGVSSISSYAFRGCANIEYVYIPDGVTSIGQYAFAECTNLESVNIPEGVSTISGYMFYACTSLRYVSIPSSVSTIVPYAFMECSSLESVSIPDGVKMIIEGTFTGCTSLSSVGIPASVKVIAGAFYRCDNITSVYFGGTAEQWNNITFDGNNGSLLSANIAFTEQYPSDPTEGSLSDTITYTIDDSGKMDIYGTGIIPENSLMYNRNVKQLIIHEGISGLDSQNIIGFSRLEYVSLPASLDYMGDWCVFYSLPSLITVDIAEGNDSFVFQDGMLLDSDRTRLIMCLDSAVGNLVIPSSVESIDLHALNFCNITSVTIPANALFRSNSNPFHGCVDLETIDVSANSNYVFEDGVLYNGDRTEVKCCVITNSGDIVVNDGVTVLGNSAFNMAGIESLITSVTVPGSVTETLYAFNCFNAPSCKVTFQEGVESIDEETFRDATLRSVSLPSTVNRIVINAFDGANLACLVYNPEAEFIESNFYSSGISGVAIYGYPGSTAEQFAEEYGLEFYDISTYSEGAEPVEGVISDTITFTIDGSGRMDIYGTGEIPSFAIQENGNITSIVIHEGITEISANAISSCPNIVNISLPASLQNIGQGAFRQLPFLQTIELSEENEYFEIYGGALYNRGKTALIKCPAMMRGELIIPESVVTIYYTATADCKLLTSITLPPQAQFVDWGDNPLASCYSLTYFDTENSAYYCYENGILYNADKTLVICCPPSVSGDIVVADTVTALRAESFMNLRNISSITLPDTITSIEGSVFKNIYAPSCSIVIPDSVEIISSGTFNGSVLKSIVLPESLGTVYIRAFRNTQSVCLVYNPNLVFTGLENASFLSGLTVYGYPGSTAEQFAEEYGVTFRDIATYDDSITQGTISDTITYTLDENGRMDIYGTGIIPSDSIAESSVTQIVIHEGISGIDDYGLTGCYNLEGISLPASLEHIGLSAFGFSPVIATIEISSESEYFEVENGILYNKGKTVLVKCPAVFYGEIIIPETVETIAYDAFNGCRATSIVFTSDAEIERYDLGGYSHNPFISCYNLTNIGTDDNDYYCFENGILYNADKTVVICCLQTVGGDIVIPETVTELSGEAFFGTGNASGVSITSIVLPEALTEISDSAFAYFYAPSCSLVIPDSIEHIDTGVFRSATLKSIVLPESLSEIDKWSFADTKAACLVYNPEIAFTDSQPFEDGAFSGIIIYGYPGSTAEQFAEEYGVTFRDIATYDDSITEGMISETISYTLDQNGVMTLSGTGVIPMDAIIERDDITSIVIGEGITGIEEFGIYYNMNLTSITMPSTMSNIVSTFSIYYNSCLEEVSFPEDNEYYCCENGVIFDKNKTTVVKCLDAVSGDIILPDSVASIMEYAFNGCPLIESVNIPKNAVFEEMAYPFVGCESLSQIDTSSSDNYHFENGLLYNKDKTELIGCLQLRGGDIVVADTVTKIYSEAFYHVGTISEVSSVTLPGSLVHIDSYAFEFTSIPSVKLTIPSSAVSIDPGAFIYLTCSGVILPDTMTDFDLYSLLRSDYDLVVSNPDMQFTNQRNVNETRIISQTGNVVIYGYIGSTAEEFANQYGITFRDITTYDVNEPDGWISDTISYTLDEKGVMVLEGTGVLYAYSVCGNDAVTEIVIGEGITGIQDYGIYGNPNLKSIIMPSSMSYIKSAYSICFNDCLQNVYFPEENEYFCSENGVIYDRDKTAVIKCVEGASGNIVLPSGVVSVNEGAFSWCGNIESLKIPQDAVFGDNINPFVGCNSLSVIDTSDSNHYHFADGILYNSDYTEVISCLIPTGGDIVLADTVTGIWERAFFKVGQEAEVTSLSLPETLTDLSSGAFEAMYAPECVLSIPDGVTVIPQAVLSRTQFDSVILPESVAEYHVSNLFSSSFSLVINNPDVLFTGVEYYDVETIHAQAEDVIIYGSVGSTAEAFADEYDLTFRDISEYLPQTTFTVSYDLRCELEAPEPQTKYASVALTLYSDSPVREGFTFLGWTTDPDGSAVEYAAGDTYEKDQDVTLYAVWQEIIPCEVHTDGDSDDVCDVCGKTLYTVTTISYLRGSGASVAPVVGGGKYAVGDKVVVYAPEVDGCTFVGWFLIYSGQIIGDTPAISGMTNYFYMAENPIDLAAVYEPIAGASIDVYAESFTMTGLDSEQEEHASKTYDIGTEVTVVFTGDNFCHWKNSNDRIVSTSPSFTFTVLGDETITAVVSETVSNSAMVEFISDYGQIILAHRYTDAEEIDFPIGPSKSGYIFDHWDMTEDDIRNEMSENNLVTVRPVYVPSGESYVITVQYPEYTDQFEAVAGDPVSITAADLSGRAFSCWKDANGNILSYSSTYYFLATSDREIIATYDEAVMPEPQAVITNAWSFTYDDMNKMSIEMTYSVPDGYTLLQAGMVRSTEATGGYLSLDSYNAKVHVSTLTTPYGVYTLTLRVGEQTNAEVYIRGYVTVLNVATGNVETYYSDQICVRYDQLPKQ